MLERDLQKKILAFLRTLYPDLWAYKVCGSPFARRGVPDIVGCFRGLFFAIEVKNPDGGKLTPSQEVEIEAIEKSGGLTVIAESVEDAKAFIDLLREAYARAQAQ